MKAISAAAAATAVLGIAGCGEETFQQDDLQTQIAASLEEEAGVAPKSVSCPSDAPAANGDEFECTGTAPNGDKFTIDIKVTSDDGDFELSVPK
jgi:uncharacterized protein DUF4333